MSEPYNRVPAGGLEAGEPVFPYVSHHLWHMFEKGETEMATFAAGVFMIVGELTKLNAELKLIRQKLPNDV